MRTCIPPRSRRFLMGLRIPITMFTFFLCTMPATGQQSPRRDASAISFLTQVISAAGGTARIEEIQDYSASGVITHFWNDKPQQGQVTLKALGLLQFRIDSNVSNGSWSFIVHNGNGNLIEPDGTRHSIAYHNCINSGSLTWPILKINAALLDQSMMIIDLGRVQFQNVKARRIRIQQNFPSDPTGLFAKLSQTDYFFDPAQFVVVQTQDYRHPDDDAVNGSLVHTVDFASYRTIDGVLVPFSISELIGGQRTWQIQLNTLSFNSGLSDSDFQF